MEKEKHKVVLTEELPDLHARRKTIENGLKFTGFLSIKTIEGLKMKIKIVGSPR